MAAVVLRPEIVGECPFDSGNAENLAMRPGGGVLFFAQKVIVDMDGRFSMPLGFTPVVTGPLLLCAYVYNEVGYTKSQASLTVDVQAVPGAPRTCGRRA